MPKRFTDTDIWKKQRWFRKLKPDDKLAFFYIKDQCNHAGLWKIDCNDLMDDTGLENFDLNVFLAAINTEFDGITGNKIVRDRILIVKNTYLWITGFLQFQYEGKDKKIAWKGGPAYTAMLELQSLNLVDEGLVKGYITLKEPLSVGWETHKEKEKEKEKDILTAPKKRKNGKDYQFSGNFKAQGEELYARRFAQREGEIDGAGRDDN
jgi:hypothetical protein